MLAVAILSACVSADIPSATPVTQEVHLTEKATLEEQKEEKALDELDVAAGKLDVKSQELSKLAEVAGASDEAKKAADAAEAEYQDADNKAQEARAEKEFNAVAAGESEKDDEDDDEDDEEDDEEEDADGEAGL